MSTVLLIASVWVGLLVLGGGLGSALGIAARRADDSSTSDFERAVERQAVALARMRDRTADGVTRGRDICTVGHDTEVVPGLRTARMR